MVAVTCLNHNAPKIELHYVNIVIWKRGDMRVGAYDSLSSSVWTPWWLRKFWVSQM